MLLANGFADAGHEVQVVTFRPGGIRASQLRVTCKPLQAIDTHLNCFAPGLAKVLLAFRPELILTMGHEANRRLRQLRKQLPEATLVATMRTGKVLSPSLLKDYAAAHVIVANSRWGKTRLIESGLAEERIVVIDNLIGTRWEDLPARTHQGHWRRTWGISPEVRVLINVAGFRRGKGQAELLAALAPLLAEGRHCLWMVGDGPQRRACQAFVNAHGLASWVRFCGHYTPIFELLAEADLLVHTSRSESQPNALIEAQAMGLPVVAWDCAGVRETLLDGQSGYVLPPGDASGLLAAVQSLCQDAERAGRFSEAASVFARQRFDDGTNLQRYLDLP